MSYQDTQEIIEILKHYEETVFLENEQYSLYVSDGKFSFHDKISNESYFAEYSLKENYDTEEYTEKEIKDIIFCIEQAEDYGFYLI